MLELLQQVFRELGYAVLELNTEGSGTPIGDAPAWFEEIWGEARADCAAIALADRSPFLGAFLDEADICWAADGGSECQSEAWVERTSKDAEMPLQATAYRFYGKRILVIRNLGSQYREQSQQLQLARSAALAHEELLREIQKKEILLHCIVHDLSQPLSAMRAAFECVAEEKLSGRGKKFAGLGKLASEEQESMIRAILQTFSADLRAAMEGTNAPGTAPDLLASAEAGMRTLLPAYEAKHVRLAIDSGVDRQAQWRVAGEETRLRRVFTNLLENALRYTPAGGSVTIGLKQEDGSATAIVDDEGKGLPQELRPEQIFGLLSKEKQGGGKAGLGLYFCKITVERWGGAIGCESRAERGSRFWFRLPLSIDANADPPKSSEYKNQERHTRSSGAAVSGLSILLADDQEDLRTLTSHQLTRAGHRVVAVADGRDAIKAVQQVRFDVVLLDEQMPIVSGVDAARALRQQGSQSNPVPLLVAVTGNATDPDRERLRAAGFDAVLAKPFRLEALNEILAGLPALTPDEILKHDSADQDDPIAVLTGRVNSDEKLMRKLIASFLRDLPSRMNSLKQAIKRGDAAEVASLAHALKGSVSIFGASQASGKAEELQNLGRKGDLHLAHRLFEFLKDDVAKLERKLRGYAEPAKAARFVKASRRTRPRGAQRKRK